MKKNRRGFVTVTVTQEVEVDVNVYLSDVIDETDDEDLIEELENRGYLIEKGKRAINLNTADGLRRYLCDLLSLSYFSGTDKIINEIKERISI